MFLTPFCSLVVQLEVIKEFVDALGERLLFGHSSLGQNFLNGADFILGLGDQALAEILENVIAQAIQ